MTITISGVNITGGVVFEVAEATVNSVNFDTAGANSWTVPAGVTSVVIKLWGGGGGGGALGYVDGPGGGGGGAYASKTLSVSGGQVLNFTVGSGGAAATFTFFYSSGSPGTASTYSTVTAGGGGGGSDGTAGPIRGSGGTASGGDVNTSGQQGFFGGSPFNTSGGLAGNSPNATANSAISPFNGIQPGGGQGGGSNYGEGTGAVGRVRFEWAS
jgi:hypothetical protein